MKPELVIQDFGGMNNADPNKTAARLMKGSSWKRQRIVTIIPADSVIPAKCALAMWNLIYPPNNGVVRILCQGLEVGDAYSKAIDQILAHPQLNEWEYILTIEQDNAPPQDGVLRLLEAIEAHKEFSAISGSYFTKGPMGYWQGWGDPKDPVLNFRPQIPVPGTIQEVCGLGMGFCLYRLQMFKDDRLPKPLFQTKRDAGGVSTQDLFFWQNARKFGYRAAVDVDCRVGHWEAATETMW